MLKKFVLMVTCVAICSLTLGCGGGSGGDPALDKAGQKAIDDAAKAVQAQKKAEGRE